MARIRNIGPRFFEDEKTAELTLGGRLLYIGLWTRCDLNGVFEWNIKVITAAIFPHDDGIDSGTVVKWMDALVVLGRVSRFEADGKRYGFIPRFTAHQAISKIERDQDAKNRLLGKNFYPDPKTVFRTVSGTVPESPDEGHMTKDGGRGAIEGPTPPPTDSKLKNRERLAKELRRHGLSASEQAVIEWGDLLMGLAECEDAEEAMEVLPRILATAKAQGIDVQYAKHARTAADARGSAKRARIAKQEESVA
jgi:hypothetical protein